tara:strand:- start:227 stop:997 length:771 start_codon:yes stop_codon:yes gene_type:complete
MTSLHNIQPVNRNRATNSSTQLIDVTKLPLYSDGNTARANALAVRLQAVKTNTPKLISSNTPAGVIRNLPTIGEMYAKTNSSPVPSNQLASLREITIDGKISSIQTISEGILSKFFMDGRNCKPESALAYAAYLSNLSNILVEYSKELRATKESFDAVNLYKYTEVAEVQELHDEQLEVEQAFVNNGSDWETENTRREKDAMTERMYAQFKEFEAYQANVATGDIVVPVEVPVVKPTVASKLAGKTKAVSTRTKAK